MQATTERLTITAHRVGTDVAVPIVPAGRTRPWIEQTTQRFAARCLPLLIANQAGWWVLNPRAFTARWDGSNALDGIQITPGQGDGRVIAESHFGHGILTFRIPWLFRTPPGWNLMVTGPLNAPKDGLAALTGIVETDWAVATFTMNWQVTRPGREIEFAAGEPICQIIPIQTGTLSEFVPQISDDIPDGYPAWKESRAAFLADQRAHIEFGWQKHYVRGTSPAGFDAPDGQHRTTLHVRPFAGED